MGRSFHNRILRVDLTAGKITVEQPGQLYLRKYMGGWNIIADFLLREVPAGADPLGAENKLIFAPGVLTGLPVSGVARNAIGAKSPLTGGFGASEAGGFMGTELKRAGFDAVVIEGVSPSPVYLWIKDADVELRDASAYWGKTTKEALTGIREELGDRRIQAAAIGPAGENLVRYACIMNELHDAAGRTGLGAVMGSKRLKAVAVRGTKKLEAADPDTVNRMAREFARAVSQGERAAGFKDYGTGGGDLEDILLSGNLPVRNFRGDEFEHIEGLGGKNFLPEVGLPMRGCFACAIRCKNVFRAERPYSIDSDYGAPEYETLGMFGSNCGIDDYVAVAKANELCNAYGIDTITAGANIALAMECFEKGWLSWEDTGKVDLRFGNADALIAMVEKIGRRQGLGDLLAQSTAEVARRIGAEAEKIAMQVKGQGYPAHEPRLKRALAIGYAVSPTGADHSHALHDMGCVVDDENGFMASEPWYTEAIRSMGAFEPIPLESLGPEKVRATVYGTIVQVMNNCIPMCLFVHWRIEEKTRLVQAATGWDVTSYELLKVGERALTLARTFNLREGFGPGDDRLPERSFKPSEFGPLSEGGIDPEELREAIRLYYEMMGWSRETGVPLAAKLHELGVGWAVDHLPH